MLGWIVLGAVAAPVAVVIAGVGALLLGSAIAGLSDALGFGVVGRGALALVVIFAFAGGAVGGLYASSSR